MTRAPERLQLDSAYPGIFGRVWERVAVGWFTLLFVLSIGIANGDSNQNSYLLLGLRLTDSNFLVGDWFTWDTVHAHQYYGLLVAVLARLGILELGLTVGAVFQNATFALTLYWLLRTLYERPLLPWAATLALFSAMDTLSLGDAPWLRPFLGVSSLAGLAMFVGIACIAYRRLLAAGIALGLSALVHAHFLVLVVPVLLAGTLAAVLDPDRPSTLRSLLRLWIPAVVLGAPAAALILRFAEAPGAQEIEWLTGSVFPYHVSPWTWRRDPVLLLLGVMILGLGGMMLRPPRSNRYLLLVWGAVIATVFVSLGLAYPQLVEPVAKAWPWRISPLLMVAGLSTGLAAVVSPEGVVNLVRARNLEAGLGLLLAGVVVIAGLSRPPITYVLLIVSSAPIVIGLGRMANQQWRATPAIVRILLAVVLTIAFTPMILEAMERSHVHFEPERADRVPLYEWVRSHTPETAVFAIPPSWEGFRLNARRPIVADWKAIPRYPPDRIVWLERIRALTGIDKPGADRFELDLAYSKIDCDRALALKIEYGVRFVIQEQPRELGCGVLVFQEGRYYVWDLGPQSEFSTH